MVQLHHVVQGIPFLHPAHLVLKDQDFLAVQTNHGNQLPREAQVDRTLLGLLLGQLGQTDHVLLLDLGYLMDQVVQVNLEVQAILLLHGGLVLPVDPMGQMDQLLLGAQVVQNFLILLVLLEDQKDLMVQEVQEVLIVHVHLEGLEVLMVLGLHVALLVLQVQILLEDQLHLFVQILL